MRSWFRNNLLLITLITFAIGLFLVTARINIFRFNNFDFGKFDLGNMTQMVWYTLQGKPLYLTDYFGANIPRWAMSHVDPILLIFVPIFALYQHALTLVFAQVTLVLSASIILYKIAQVKFKSSVAGFLVGLAYLFYPAVGFLNAWTGFHGVTAVIPFFLIAFYIFEYMHSRNAYTTKNLILFWVFLILTMMGKEQLPLYVFVFGFYVICCRMPEKVTIPKKNYLKWLKSLAVYKNVQLGLAMMFIGAIWFFLAFSVIIPAFAHYRVESFQKFAETIELDTTVARDVQSPNYFISRYEAFGDTYTEVVVGMLSNPEELVRVIFGGDKIENLRQTLEPVGYAPLLNPMIFAMAFPDFLINYATTEGGIGTSEIINHRISMIIPVLFLASIYGIYTLSGFVHQIINRKIGVKKDYVIYVLLVIFLGANIRATFAYENPVYLWLQQAIEKRMQVFAKEDLEVGLKSDIVIGERFKLSALDNKDRECALKVIDIIPEEASISGPDYLGAHLAMRETYAIFPALYKNADYVIVDVFSQKILRILDLDVTIVRDVVADMIKNPEYDLRLGCGNLFVFKKVGPHEKSIVLPLQESFEYDEKVNLEIFESLTIVDYSLPQRVTRGQPSMAKFVYVKREEERLDDYVLFTSFINDSTGELYQMANLPSFSLNQLRNWREDRYYLEDVAIVLPEFLDTGTYRVFIGMTNNIRTRSIYLGDIIIE